MIVDSIFILWSGKLEYIFLNHICSIATQVSKIYSFENKRQNLMHIVVDVFKLQI